MGILQRVYVKIVDHLQYTELFRRLEEECIEMAETCSRGHLIRLMNVFSGFEDTTITIDPLIELKSLVHKRVQVYMETLKDQYEKISKHKGQFVFLERKYSDDELTNDFTGIEGTSILELVKDRKAIEFTPVEEQKELELTQQQSRQTDLQSFQTSYGYDLDDFKQEVDELERVDLYDQVMDAWVDGDQQILQKYLYPKLSEIHDEVQKEYVGQNIMTSEDFSVAFRDITSNLFSVE